MKLNKRLLIGNEQLKIISDDIRLNLFSPGRAVFTVQSETVCEGVVQLYMGYKVSEMQPFFTGYIESSTTLDSKQQRIFCRELQATLNRRLVLNLRHPTLQDTLRTIAGDSGLIFLTPDQAYATTMVPRFDSVGNGYHAIDSIADVFKIPKLICQQQPDNRIFVGSWEHSYWFDKPLEIPIKWQTNFGVSNSSRIPAVPKIRPGIKINENYLTAVHMSESHMQLTWNKNPWRGSYGS